MAQSFVTSNKAETAPRHYNLRVAECTLAAVVLAKANDLTLPKDNSSLGYSLRTFHNELMRKEGRLGDPLEYQIDSVIQATQDLLTQEQGYTREEIGQLLGISVSDLEAKYLSSFPVQAERFLLRQRALHCFKEARRVLDFKACLAHAKTLDDSKIHYLGQLLNESQASCREVYECSAPQVDEICAIARKAGTWGSRLTGAGWGGCTVHMLPQSKVEAVTKALKEEYYLKYFPDISEEKLKEAMVISKPSNGSFMYVSSPVTIILDQIDSDADMAIGLREPQLTKFRSKLRRRREIDIIIISCLTCYVVSNHIMTQAMILHPLEISQTPVYLVSLINPGQPVLSSTYRSVKTHLSGLDPWRLWPSLRRSHTRAGPAQNNDAYAVLL